MSPRTPLGLNAALLGSDPRLAQARAARERPLPERVIQFGEGNFLRGFADWMLERMNQRGLFQGRAVLVQPIASGSCELINRQDGLYTVLLRGKRDKAMAESTVYANQIAKEENEKALEAVRASGKTAIHTPTAEEKAAFKKAFMPVHKKMESRIGAELIQSIYKETGFDPAKL